MLQTHGQGYHRRQGTYTDGHFYHDLLTYYYISTPITMYTAQVLCRTPHIHMRAGCAADSAYSERIRKGEKKEEMI